MTNTSEIGAFKVVSEGGIASGVRRIEAVAGAAAVEYLNSLDGVVRQLAGSLKVGTGGAAGDGRRGPGARRTLGLMAAAWDGATASTAPCVAGSGRSARPPGSSSDSARRQHPNPQPPPRPRGRTRPSGPLPLPRSQARPDELPGRVAALQDDLKAAAKAVAELQGQLAVAKSAALAGAAERTPGGAAVLVAELAGVDAKALGEAAGSLLAALGDPAAVLLGTAAADGKANFVCALSPGAVAAGLQAGKVVGQVAKVCGGGGGGKPALAQAGGKDASKLPEALAAAREALMGGLP